MKYFQNMIGAFYSLASSPLPPCYASEPLFDIPKCNVIGPSPDTKVKVPVSGTEETGRPSLAEKNTTRAHALSAVQQITSSASPPPAATAEVIACIFSDGASKARTFY